MKNEEGELLLIYIYIYTCPTCYTVNVHQLSYTHTAWLLADLCELWWTADASISTDY